MDPEVQAILDLADQLEPEMRAVIRRLIEDFRDSIDIPALAQALAAGDAAAALAAVPVQILSAHLGPLADIVGQAVSGAAALAAPTAVGVLAFDMRNPRILDFLNAHVFQLAGKITDEARASTVNIIRSAVVEGKHPYESAREIQRVIGLFPRWENAVKNYRAGLLRGGTSRSKAEVMADRYADKLRLKRARMIARTETLRATNAGLLLQWLDEVARGEMVATAQKRWVVTPDDRLCPYCAPLDGKTVGLMEDFEATFMGLPYAAGEFGETVRVPVKLNPKRAEMTVLHPPLHPNCRCSLVSVGESLPLAV